MTDEIQRLFDRYTAGELDFNTFQQHLAVLIEQDSGNVAAIAARVDTLYRSGQLPPQLYHLLIGQLGVELEPPGAPVDEPTNVAERTRVKPKQLDEPTNVREKTRLKPGGSADGTGSNWAHPEQWSDRQAGPVGPGQTVKDRFYLESILGQGGMGVVFKARDRLKDEARDPDPYVAMKVLSEDFRQHPQAFVALQREWKKVQSLSHENIITVYDFDRDGSTVFMTMQLLEGEPLNQVLKNYSVRGLRKERAVAIVEGCARALAFAHSKGIVHADFKPGNVFVNEKNEVKVLDFGIARAVPTALQPDADETVFHATDLGALTPTYASAQMLDGKEPRPVDDVYALAVVAYELFTGRHPYDRTPADEARRKKLATIPPAGLTRRQRRTIMRGLSFDADARQLDAGVFYRQWRGLELPRWVYGALAASLLAAVFLGWKASQDPGPDRPFSQLAQEEQAKFRDKIREGGEALSYVTNEGITALWPNAIRSFKEAYEIHPRNPDAVKGLENTADAWLEWVDDKAEDERQRLLRSGLENFVCQEHLNTYRPIERACKETFGANRCTLSGFRMSSGSPCESVTTD